MNKSQNYSEKLLAELKLNLLNSMTCYKVHNSTSIQSFQIPDQIQYFIVQ